MHIKMKTKMKDKLLILAILSCFLSPSVNAEVVPDGAIPLSQIIAGLEQRGLNRIERIEVNHGHWEIRIRQESQNLELRIDPMTGEITGQDLD